MSGDSHTKGSIDPACMLKLMLGYFDFEHAVKDFTARRPMTPAIAEDSTWS
jgi:hypothetical protein